jgi:hypothetical protein
MVVVPFQQDKPQCSRAYHALACIMIGYVQLTKAICQANHTLSVGEKHVRGWLQEGRIR